MKNLKIFLSLLFFVSLLSSAQTKTSLNDELKNSKLAIGFEYRPRTEYRNGFRNFPTVTTKPAFFTSHRARIDVTYKISNFLIHTTLQDIRVWGDTDTRNANGKAQFYEFYVEPKLTKYISARIGRQRIKYDNQRLFAENNWRQAGGQHDAILFLYKKNTLSSDLILAYNQDKEKDFGTNFNIDWDMYRAMMASLSTYTLSEHLKITSIQVADEYTDPATNNSKGYWKFTNGGRISYTTQNLFFTLAGYYQWGKIENGKQHNAYYIEPEIKWTVTNKYSLLMGAQIFSGDTNATDTKSTAFLAQYGAFHKHNGGLDYTQQTVRTNEHSGVLNPYIKQKLVLNSTFNIEWESHLLGTQTQLKTHTNGIENNLNRFYGWENDFKLNYKPNSYTNIQVAYLFLSPQKNITALETGINADLSKIAQFAYVSVQWAPKALNILK